jgi:hypothetical protein
LAIFFEAFLTQSSILLIQADLHVSTAGSGF